MLLKEHGFAIGEINNLANPDLTVYYNKIVAQIEKKNDLIRQQNARSGKTVKYMGD